MRRLLIFVLHIVSGTVNDQLICPKIQVGEDDLPGFDLISQLSEHKLPAGVSFVNGSSEYQVAYKLHRTAYLATATRGIFPHGVPSHYSFVSTFRMLGETLNKPWYLWTIENQAGDIQAGIKLNGARHMVEVVCQSIDGVPIKASFANVKLLFDENWHKLVLSLDGAQVSLYVDCVKVGNQLFNGKRRIAKSGYIRVGRRGKVRSATSCPNCDSNCDVQDHTNDLPLYREFIWIRSGDISYELA